MSLVYPLCVLLDVAEFGRQYQAMCVRALPLSVVSSGPCNFFRLFAFLAAYGYFTVS